MAEAALRVTQARHYPNKKAGVTAGFSVSFDPPISGAKALA
ncbi:hypothetical protein FHR88_003828 [Bradyrhizobium betae]|nr:hypothetical protein [Bradyrhizobium betae]